jgi:hypothetical protein
MQAFGHLVIAWTWLDVVLACRRQRARRRTKAGRAARYFFHYELPKIGLAAGRRNARPHLRRPCPRRLSEWHGNVRTLARLDTLIWSLIYGGLFLLVLGIASHDETAPSAAGACRAGLAGRHRRRGADRSTCARACARRRPGPAHNRTETLNKEETPSMTRTVQQLFDLEGKTALVTGGSRGLGLQLAHALGEAGARIMLSSRKAGDLEEAAADLQAAGIDARWIAADCSREEDIRKLADETSSAWARRHPGEQRRRRLGRAGRGPPGGSLGQGDEPQRPRLFHPQQQVAKRSMIPRKYGRIINIASIAGLGGNPPR